MSRKYTWLYQTLNEPDSEVLWNREMRNLVDVLMEIPNTVRTTVDYDVVGVEDFVLVDAPSTLLVQLPPYDPNLNQLTIKKIDASTSNVVTVGGFDSQLIDFSSSLDLTEQGQCVTLVPTDDQWWIIGGYP